VRPIEVKHRGRRKEINYTWGRKREKKKKKRKKKERKKKNNQSKYKVLILKTSHKKWGENNSKITKSIFHHFCPGLPVPVIFRLVR